jgi:hypothetical protein
MGRSDGICRSRRSSSARVPVRRVIDLFFSPVAWFMAAQFLGSGAILPFFFALHLRDYSTIPHSRVAQFLPSNKAKALIISTILGTLVPSWYTFGPPQLNRTPEQHQLILALWFYWPVYTGVLTHLLSPLLAKKESLATRRNWTVITYIFALLIAFSGNAYQRYSYFLTKDPALSWYEVFLPNAYEALEGGLLEKAKFFLQADWWCMTVPAMVWALAGLRRDGVVDEYQIMIVCVAGRFAWTLVGEMGLVAGVLAYKEVVLVDRETKKTEEVEAKKEK